MTDQFMPHGMCFAWQRNVLGLHVISDAVIALAYFSIPITLAIFASKRRDLPFRWLFAMFGAFIVSCGATHVLGIWTIWHPDYWVDGAVKAFTAMVSAVTAIALIALLPRALAIRSPQENERLGNLAFFDALTGLPNRVLLHDRLGQTIRTSLRRDERFAVLFLDIDGFKEINDRFGHAAGDGVLKIVAKRLQAELRQSDTVARLGGDEFVIIGAAVATSIDASRFAERILATMREPIQEGAHKHELSVSIGVSFYPIDGTEQTELLQKADAALYKAKQSGKNSAHFASYDAGEQAVNGVANHAV